MESISRTFSVSLNQVTFWSDSINVLWWIKGRSQSFKSFVANRVGEIQTETDPRQWRFVPTEKNPADLFFLKWPFWLQEDLVWPVNKVELPKKSKPLPLQPRLDEEGQIRCDSRLRYAEFLEDIKSRN